MTERFAQPQKSQVQAALNHLVSRVAGLGPL
jgi:hypothetical protein